MPIQRTRPCPFSQRVGSTIVEQDIDFIPTTRPFITLDDIVNQEVTNAVNGLVSRNLSLYEQYRSRLTSTSFAKAANAKLIAISESLNEAGSRELIREAAILGAEEELQKINIEIIEQNRISAIRNAIVPARDSAVQDAIVRYPSVANFLNNITNFTDTQVRIAAERAINNNVKEENAILSIQSAANQAAESRASSIYDQQVADAAAAQAAAAAAAAEAARQQAEAERIARENADDDGDGVRNIDDRFPNDSREWSDVNGNGVGDNADAATRAEEARRQGIRDFGNLGSGLYAIEQGLGQVISSITVQYSLNNSEFTEVRNFLITVGQSKKNEEVQKAINNGSSVAAAEQAIIQGLVEFYQQSGPAFVLQKVTELRPPPTQKQEDEPAKLVPPPESAAAPPKLAISGFNSKTKNNVTTVFYKSESLLTFSNIPVGTNLIKGKFLYKRPSDGIFINATTSSNPFDQSTKILENFPISKKINSEAIGKQGQIIISCIIKRPLDGAETVLNTLEVLITYE